MCELETYLLHLEYTKGFGKACYIPSVLTSFQRRVSTDFEKGSSDV